MSGTDQSAVQPGDNPQSQGVSLGGDNNSAPPAPAGIPLLDLGTITVTPDDNASSMTAGAGGGSQPGVSDTFNLKLGGAVDLAKMPTQIAPLDQLSSFRIGQHAGFTDTNTPDLAPIDGDMPAVEPAQLPANIRYEYGQQLQNGDVNDAQDFAEQLVGNAWKNATWSQPDTDFDANSAQLTNAAKSIAGGLPTDDELNTFATYIARAQLGVPADAEQDATAVIKSNLLDAYGETGKSPMEMTQRAAIDPSVAVQLATPRPMPPVHYPTPEELPVPHEQGVSDPLGNMMTDPLGLHALGKALGFSDVVQDQADYDKKFDELRSQGKTIGQAVAQLGVDPMSLSFGMGTVSNIAPVAGPTIGAALRTLISGNSISLDQSMARSAQTEAEKGLIRQNVGMANYSKAVAKQALEKSYSTVNPMVPGYLQWLQDFQARAKDYALQKDRFVANGGDPDAFTAVDPATLVQGYHPLQALFDHMENRPGGARLDPSSPLHPLAETMRGLLDERKAELANLSDTIGLWEDYYPHAWLDPRVKVDDAFHTVYGPGRQGSAYHLQGRSVPTIFDGITRGLTPKFPNPIEGALHYMASIDDYLAAERVRQTMLDQGHAYYAQQPQLGDVPLKGRAATRPRVYNDAEGNANAYTEQLYAAPGFARVYNNWVGRGIAEWAGPGAQTVYNKLLMAKNALLGLAFGLSGFHPMVIAKQTTASAIANGIGELSKGDLENGLWHAGMGAITPVQVTKQVAKGARFDSVYMGTAPNPTPLEQQLKDIYVKAGGVAPSQGRGEPYFASQARNLFTEWSRAGAWGSEGYPIEKAIMAPAAVPATALKSTARDLAGAIGNSTESIPKRAALTIPRAVGAIAENFGRVSDTIMSPLFDKIIPQIKRAAWADEMESYIRSHPLADEAELLRVGRQAMDSMDDRFGEMNMENVFWPRTVKQIAQLMTVSTGWEYGSWRAAGRGLEDLATAPQGERMTTRARALMGYVGAMALFASVYQYLKTGSTPFSTGLWNFATPLSRGNDPASAVQVPGEEKEATRVWSLLQRAGGDPVRWIQAAGQYVWGKANPVVRDTQAIFQSKDYHDFFKRLLDNSTPYMVSNKSPNADLSPFEKWLGFRSAPSAATGAPAHASRTARRAGDALMRQSREPVYRNHHAGQGNGPRQYNPGS